MYRAFIGIGAALLLTACQGPAPERYRSADGEFSIHAPGDAWTEFHDKGSVVFRGAAESARAQTTIAIRSVPTDERHTASEVVDATAAVLAALPSVEIHGRYRTEHERFDATAFDLTFVPKSKAAPYERRHVVLTGSSQRVYHLMLTAPAGDLERSTGLFDDIVGSLKREG